MNKSYVTTGILYDRVFPIAHLDEHPGLSFSEDTSSSDHFKQGYYELYNAMYTPGSSLTPEDLENMLDTFHIWNGHPIGLMYYKFNSLDTNALQDHLVDTLANGQFKDVFPRPRSPYFENTVFMASPLIADDEVFEKGEHTFYLDSRFFLQNASMRVKQVRIDFGDGQGEWIVDNPFDSSFATRGTTGVMGLGGVITKNIVTSLVGKAIVILMDIWGSEYTVKGLFNINVPGGKSPDDYAELTICKGGKFVSDRWVIEAPSSRLAPINALYGNPQLDYTRKVEMPCPGFPFLHCKVKVPVKDTAYFYFAGNGTACNVNVLRKPIVFIDGFDPTNNRGVQQIYEDYINKNVTRSINGTPSTVSFGDYMLNQGYDFVILDFKHGNDLLERNAMTLVSLLERLYQTYGSTFEQDITIIGPSMGSLIAQYALAYMEHNNIPHHVKTYISFDGCHQGANVPIGLQYMVEYITKRGILSKLNKVKSLIRNGLYNGLAARQMLAHHVSANSPSPAPDALRTTFLANLQAVGEYPSLTRNVAIINGVSTGVINEEHPTANTTLLQIINKRKGWKSLWGACNWNVCKNLAWESKTTPATGTASVSDMWTLNAVINLIFWVPPFETIKYANGAWGNSSLDNAPGGKFGTIFGTQGGDVDQRKLSFLIKEGLYLLTGSKRTTFYQNINNFTMMPSYSAADLRFANKNLYMNWSKEYLCGMTPFDFVYAPTTENEEHVSVTQKGSEWFEAEIKCSKTDLPVIVSPISGSATLCASENYTITFCKPGNRSITWTVSDPSVVNINGSGTQVTLIKKKNGIITLTATVTYPCTVDGALLKTMITKEITVGTRKPGIISWEWNVPPKRVTLSVDAVPGATAYKWYLNGTLKATTSTSYYQLPMNGNVNCGQFYYFGVKVQDNCGLSDESYIGAYMPQCESGFKLLPNPATTSITIELDDAVEEKEAKSVSLPTIRQVEIYNKTGVFIKRYQFATGVSKTTIPVDNLPADIYTVRVFDGEKWYAYKISVLR